jgi:hypothetical protein
VATVRTVTVDVCTPPFTAVMTAQDCPAESAVAEVTRMLGPLAHRRQRQSPPRVYAGAHAALRTGGPSLDDIPSGATFTNIPCAPVCPADPGPPPATCQAPLGLFQLGASCLGAGEPLLTAAIRRRVARGRRH